MDKRLISLLSIGLFLLFSINLFAYDYSKIPGAETYPRANSVIALSEHAYMLNDGGSYAAKFHVIRKILNQKGKRRFAEFKITYTRKFQEVEIENAQTINSDGSIETVREEEINDMDSRALIKAPRYPAIGIRVISFPSVDVGDVVEISYRIKTNTNFPFYGEECFQFYDPLLCKKVTIEVPEGTLLHFNQPAGVNFLQSREDGRIKYEWTARDKKPIVEEDNLPPLNYLAPTLYYSNIPDLKGFLSGLNRRMREKATVTLEMRERAAGIIGQGSTDYTKIRRLYDFVAGQVNSIELDLKAIGGFMSDAPRVLRDGYGNSYDKSILLYGLLQSVGMEPHFCFLLGNRRLQLYQEELREQSFSAISRPLVAVNLGNQKLYLDPMLQDGQYGPLGISIDGSICYLIEGERVSSEEVNIPDSLLSGKWVRTEVQIGANGDARLVQREEYSGVEYARVKKVHEELSPKKLEEYVQKKLNHLSKNAIPVGALQIRESPSKFIEAFSCRVPHYGIADGDFLYFDLGKAVSEALEGYIHISTKRRYNPYFNPVKERETVDLKVVLPRGYQVLFAPGGFQQDLPGGLGRISYQKDSGDGYSLRYRLKIDLDEAILSIKDYKQLYAIKEELGGRKYSKVLLRKE